MFANPSRQPGNLGFDPLSLLPQNDKEADKMREKGAPLPHRCERVPRGVS